MYKLQSDFTEIDFEENNIAKEASLGGANLTEACLEGANLRGVAFDVEPDCYLEGANLTEARLCGADLTGANFKGTNIKGADFEGANLEGANLEGADFTEIDFEEDDIDDSLFPSLYKHNLTTAQLSKVKSLYGAKNLNHEFETAIREKYPKLFEETDDHKQYRNFSSI